MKLHFTNFIANTIKMKKKIAVFLCLCTVTMFSQEWVTKMLDTNANFYEIKASFENYWKDRSYERGKGFNAFKRWAWFVEPRVYPTGNMKLASRGYAYEQYQKFLKEEQAHSNNKVSSTSAIQATTAAWTALGPFGSPTNGDAGRVQVIKTLPGNANYIFVGTAAGGLWISTNGGTSYNTSTDLLPSLGVADIAISPTATNVIYIATGDKDAGDTHSTGVMKSTDGGITFTTTGLTWTTDQSRRIYRLLIDPTNANNMIVASSVGIYRSTDAGVTWTQTSPLNVYDAEFKPGSPSTVYAVTASTLLKSTDGGVTFSSVSVAASANRLSLAVTPANANYVYVLASAPSNAFGGLYRSTNSGAAFTLMSTTPNIFDWAVNGSGTGGQGWYDIAIDASPTNADEIIAGGVNTWRSTNGGSTWTLHTHWTGGGGKPYVHADLHHVYYVSGTTIFLGTDGGIARTTNGGTTYSTINGNMNIAQIYKLGNSATTAGRIITGHQDNGTNLSNGAAWAEVKGGDGMDCFVDWNNDNILVGSYVNGAYARSTNGGTTWGNIVTGLTGSAAWVAPIVQDPVSPNTYYAGYSSMFKSTNGGASWVQMGSTTMGVLDEIYVCASNPNVIYATTVGSVWKTTNGGTTWINITTGVPVGSAAVTDITCDNNNPNNVYVTLSGYVAGTKVYASNDGGVTWSNYSTGLPNIPANCIIYRNNSPQVLYVGTDVGVYYRESSMSSWINYSNLLPNVVIDELDIFYPTQKLRAATYGRGVWETPLYSNPLAPPFAYFTTAYNAACVNVPFVFNDQSANSPTTYTWNFPGGTPATSSVQNPTVTYAAAGIYTVILFSGNANGPSAPYSTTISVVNPATVAVSNVTVCSGNNALITLTTNATSAVWSTNANGLSLSIPNATASAVYGYTASLGACKTIGSSSLTVINPPPTPTISTIGNSLTTTSAPSYQWYLNGSPIPGETNQNYEPTQDGWYTVYVYNNGCPSAATPIYISITNLKNNITTVEGLQVSPNPAKDVLKITWLNTTRTPMSYEIVNIIGQKIQSGILKAENGNLSTLNIQHLAPGTYVLKVSESSHSSTTKFIKE